MMKRTLLATLAMILVPLLRWVWEEPDNFQGLSCGADVTQAIPECPYNTPSAGSERSPHGQEDAVLHILPDHPHLLEPAVPQGRHVQIKNRCLPFSRPPGKPPLPLGEQFL